MGDFDFSSMQDATDEIYAAVLYHATFVVFKFVMVMNILLAILMDAYAEVKREADEKKAKLNEEHRVFSQMPLTPQVDTCFGDRTYKLAWSDTMLEVPYALCSTFPILSRACKPAQSAAINNLIQSLKGTTIQAEAVPDEITLQTLVQGYNIHPRMAYIWVCMAAAIHKQEHEQKQEETI